MSPEIIDLRSDTVTRPTPAMRRVIADAEVGDDQFGEDPCTIRLQERCAALFGKEAALWLPTGTMANQVALRVSTRPGDDVIVSRESHAVLHETGAGAANSGVQFTEIGGAAGGALFTLDTFLAAIKPRGHMLYPPTTMVQIENTHNRAGGLVWNQPEVERICAAARAHGITSYLDGARIWNAAVASCTTVAALAAPFDLVGAAFSKGLGAPGGAILAGSRDTIARCIRYRRMQGGAMRQIGFFTAPALFALDHHLDRLADDHAHARLIADRLAQSSRIDLDPAAVRTNIVVFSLRPEAPDAPAIVARARDRGVLCIAFGPRTIRVVTHLDVTRDQCARAAEILADIIGG